MQAVLRDIVVLVCEIANMPGQLAMHKPISVNDKKLCPQNNQRHADSLVSVSPASFTCHLHCYHGVNVCSSAGTCICIITVLSLTRCF